MTTGMVRSSADAFMRCSSSMPSTPGSITSSTTRSGFSVWSADQNDTPSAKPRASNPVDESV